MIHAVTSTPQAPVAESTPASRPAQPKATSPAVSAPNDTVTISNAALALLKEVAETPAQTAKEAAGGDLQAKRLLAKEAAERTR